MIFKYKIIKIQFFYNILYYDNNINIYINNNEYYL